MTLLYHSTVDPPGCHHHQHNTRHLLWQQQLRLCRPSTTIFSRIFHHVSSRASVAVFQNDGFQPTIQTANILCCHQIASDKTSSRHQSTGYDSQGMFQSTFVWRTWSTAAWCALGLFIGCHSGWYQRGKLIHEFVWWIYVSKWNFFFLSTTTPVF
jgi:hypothetical protein